MEGCLSCAYRPYDDETAFDQMKKFIQENDLEIITLAHREIYISARAGQIHQKNSFRYKSGGVKSPGTLLPFFPL